MMILRNYCNKLFDKTPDGKITQEMCSLFERIFYTLGVSYVSGK